MSLALSFVLAVCRYKSATPHYLTRGSLHTLDNSRNSVPAGMAEATHNPMLSGGTTGPTTSGTSVSASDGAGAREEARRAGGARPPPAFSSALESMVKKRQISVNEQL